MRLNSKLRVLCVIRYAWARRAWMRRTSILRSSFLSIVPLLSVSNLSRPNRVGQRGDAHLVTVEMRIALCGRISSVRHKKHTPGTTSFMDSDCKGLWIHVRACVRACVSAPLEEGEEGIAIDVAVLPPQRAGLGYFSLFQTIIFDSASFCRAKPMHAMLPNPHPSKMLPHPRSRKAKWPIPSVVFFLPPVGIFALLVKIDSRISNSLNP